MSTSFLDAATRRTSDALCASNYGATSAPLVVEQLVLEHMLVELEIEKYKEAFADASIDDERLNAVRAEGEEAVEELIKLVGLRGGSATKVRRKLLAKASPHPDQPDGLEKSRQSGRRRAKNASAADGSASAEAAPPPQSGAVRCASGVYKVGSQGDLDGLFQGDDARPVVVLEFNATWCGGCKKFTPTFERLVEELPQSYLCCADVDEAPELAQSYAVSQLPHFVIFRDGRKWDVLIGGKATILRQKIQFAVEGRKSNASSTQSKRADSSGQKVKH